MVSKALEEKFDYHMNDTTSDMYEHFPVLRTIGLNCDIVVELGVRNIVSTWAFLMGLASSESRLIGNADSNQLTMTSTKKLISYDITHPEKFNANIEEVYDIAKENEVSFEFHEADTLKIEIPLCNAIFFDTDQTYIQLSQELELHGNKADRYLLFHDTMQMATEIIPAINEFLEKNKEWLIRRVDNYCHGLTVLARTTKEQVIAQTLAWEESKPKS